MHAVVDQPIDIAPQLGLVDLAVRVERHDVRGEDAGEALGAGHGELVG